VRDHTRRRRLRLSEATIHTGVPPIASDVAEPLPVFFH